MTRKQWDHYKATGEMDKWTEYWEPAPGVAQLAWRWDWQNSTVDHRLRDNNLICRTKRDAQALAREMLAVARNRKETP